MKSLLFIALVVISGANAENEAARDARKVLSQIGNNILILICTFLLNLPFCL